MSKNTIPALATPSAVGDAMPVARPATGRSREVAAVWLRGLGQLALVDTAAGGALVLAAIALVNPWCALGAAIGAVIGTLAGCRITGVTREEWRSGLAGFNCAVIGIMAGGSFTTGAWRVDAILLATILCLLLEYGIRRLLVRQALPILTMPAVVAVVLTSLLLAPSGTWLWVSPGPPAFGAAGIAMAILCVVLAMASKSVAATLQVAVLICAAILACRWLGFDPLTLTGLWAFTIAPASYTVHAVLMRGSLLGGVAGCAAAAIGVTIWMVWHASGLGGDIPPLLAPFIIGVWCALLGFRRLGQPAIFQPSFWQALAALWIARLRGSPVVAIVVNTPHHGSRSILPNQEAPSDELFAESRNMRRTWWQTYHDSRSRFLNAASNPTYDALVLMQRRNCLGTLMTFAMDGLLLRAGAEHVVELQGGLESVRCLGCCTRHEWPPANIWKTCDLHCTGCGGLIMPGPPPMKEIIDATRRSIAQSLGHGGVLVVVGTLEDSRAARTVFGEARARDARIINITPEPSLTPLRAGEILVRSEIASTLRSFARLLVTFPIATRIPGMRFALARFDSWSGT